MSRETRRISIPESIIRLVIGELKHEEWDSERDGEVAYDLYKRLETSSVGTCRFDLTPHEVDVLYLTLRGKVETGLYEEDGPAVARSMSALAGRLYRANYSVHAQRAREGRA